MSEKQASSEIAQSRERFDKWLYDQGRDYVEMHGGTAYKIWQAAERDTRERVARIVEQWVVNQFLPAGSLKKLAERIRGKE